MRYRCYYPPPLWARKKFNKPTKKIKNPPRHQQGGPPPWKTREERGGHAPKRRPEDQKSVICFPWDYRESRRGLLRTFVSNHWYVTQPFIRSGFYTKEQQALIHDVFTGLVNPEWYDRFLRATKDDTFGQDWGDEQSIGIFGTPGDGPFQLVLTGRHMTLRTGGGGDGRMAFGGPILYGHATGGYYTEKPHHPGNVFWHQAELANRILQMLTPEQRARALVPRLPDEADVAFQGPGRRLPGISSGGRWRTSRGPRSMSCWASCSSRFETRTGAGAGMPPQAGRPGALQPGVLPGGPARARRNLRQLAPGGAGLRLVLPRLAAPSRLGARRRHPDVPVNGRVRFVADPWPASIRATAAPGAKVVAITTVKNEIDIVEAFVRHTLAVVNHLVILDNGSTDGTLVVLRALEREGLPLTIIEDASTGKYLSQRMTHLMRDHAVARHAADWVVPIDADEFLVVPHGEPLIPRSASSDAVLSLPWRTYVPDERDDPGGSTRCCACATAWSRKGTRG